VHNTDDHCSELKLQSTMHGSDANSLKDVGSLFATWCLYGGGGPIGGSSL